MRAKREWTVASLLAVLVLTFALAQPAWAQTPITRIRNAAITILHATTATFGTVTASGLVTGDDVTAVDDVTAGDDVIATDDLIALGGANITENLTVNGDNIIGGYLLTAASTQLEVTEGGVITPTATFMSLTATGAVTTGVILPGTAGRYLVLLNATADAITIPDSTTNMLTGAIVLGQYDTLTLISDGTNWIMLSTSNN